MFLSILLKSAEESSNLGVYLLGTLPFSVFFLKKRFNKWANESVRSAREKMAICILLSFITALLALVCLIGGFSKGGLISTKGLLGLGFGFLGLTILFIFVAILESRKIKKFSEN